MASRASRVVACHTGGIATTPAPHTAVPVAASMASLRVHRVGSPRAPVRSSARASPCRRHPTAIWNGAWLVTAPSQPTSCSCPHNTGSVLCRAAVVVVVMRKGGAVNSEELGYVQVAVLACHVQRSSPILGFCCVGVGAVLKEPVLPPRSLGGMPRSAQSTHWPSLLHRGRRCVQGAAVPPPRSHLWMSRTAQ